MKLRQFGWLLIAPWLTACSLFSDTSPLEVRQQKLVESDSRLICLERIAVYSDSELTEDNRYYNHEQIEKGQAVLVQKLKEAGFKKEDCRLSKGGQWHLVIISYPHSKFLGAITSVGIKVRVYDQPLGNCSENEWILEIVANEPLGGLSDQGIRKTISRLMDQVVAELKTKLQSIDSMP